MLDVLLGVVVLERSEATPRSSPLMERYPELGRRDDVRFLVISSNVIYPDGR